MKGQLQAKGKMYKMVVRGAMMFGLNSGIYKMSDCIKQLILDRSNTHNYKKAKKMKAPIVYPGCTTERQDGVNYLFAAGTT